MISELLRLAEVAGLSGYASHRTRSVHWLIDLDAEGNVLGFCPTIQSAKSFKGERTEYRGKRFKMAANYHMQWKDGKIQSVCTNQHNWLPDFLSGPPNEIFPGGVNGVNPAAHKQQQWQCLIEAAKNDPSFASSPVIQAIARFLARVPSFSELPIDLPDEERKRLLDDFSGGKETISFRVNGEIAASDLQLQLWWGKRVELQRDQVIAKLKKGRDAYLSNEGPITEYFPTILSSVPFASFNNAPFVSFGLGNQTATFRLETAEKVAASLNQLLNDSNTSLRLGEETAVFWAVARSSGQQLAADFIQLLDQPDPLAVQDYLRGIWGTKPSDIETTDFHVAILLKGTGRFSVRSWHTDTLASVDRHFRHYFAAIALSGKETVTPALKELASVTIAKTRKQKSKPAPATFNEVFDTAWRGSPLSFNLLAAAISRQRIELAVGDVTGKEAESRLRARTALIQLYFALKSNNPFLTTIEFIMNTKDTAILCGRLLALLAKIHDVAHKGKSASSPANRLYGAASATPALVFPRLCHLARYHLQKMNAGTAYMLEFGVDKDRRADGVNEDFEGLVAIAARLKDASGGDFPKILSLEDQGRFALGFYYERAREWPGFKDRKTQTPNF